MTNIFDLPSSLPNKELFQSIVCADNILIERILSTGQTTPRGKWYDQDQDEWVILLQGEAVLSYADGSQIKLLTGDYLLIKNIALNIPLPILPVSGWLFMAI